MERINCPNCSADNLANSKYCSRCGQTLPTITIQSPPDNIIQPTIVAQGKNKKSLISIAGIIVFGLSYFAVQHFFFKPASFDKAMMAAASELNKTCPIMVDQETRLDNAVALPDNAFQYNYTLVNMENTEVNPDTLKKYIEPGIINNVKTSPDLKIYRDNKTTMLYNYRDKNGVFILKLSVTPEMYQQ